MNDNRSTNRTSEISALRKEGRLDEAYTMALACMDATPDDPWVQTAMFYVLRDMCNNAINQHQTADATAMVEIMEQLCPTMKDDDKRGDKVCAAIRQRLLPGGNTVAEASKKSKDGDAGGAYDMVKELIADPADADIELRESLGWILYRYIKASMDSLSSREVRTLLNYYIKLGNERPSLLHSQMLNIAVSISWKHSDFRFGAFFKLWGPENLRGEDTQEYHKDGDDKTYPSLLSRVCRQIVNSGGIVDVSAIPEDMRSIATEAIRQASFWKIYNMYIDKGTDRRLLLAAFTTYNDHYASLGPSHWHSEILDLAVRTMTGEDQWRFLRFFKAWNADNLTADDWKDTPNDKGLPYPSTAVKAAKKCLECMEAQGQHRSSDDVAWLAAFYDTVIEHKPDDLWIKRQRAIIYTWQGDNDNALRLYKELLLPLGDKYYIWSELANLTDGDGDLRIALYSKALTLERNELYLGKIRLSLADELIKKGMTAEALYELNTYKKNHDNVSPRYETLMSAVGSGVSPVHDNKRLYAEGAARADDYAYDGIAKEAVAAVTDIDTKANCCYITFGEGGDGKAKISLKKSKLHPTIGQCLKVRYYMTKDDKGQTRVRVIRAKPTSETNERAVKRIHGLLKVKMRKENTSELPDYAFVKNYYVHAKVLRRHKITANCEVDAVVVYKDDMDKWTVADICL